MQKVFAGLRVERVHRVNRVDRMFLGMLFS